MHFLIHGLQICPTEAGLVDVTGWAAAQRSPSQSQCVSLTSAGLAASMLLNETLKC